MRSARAIRLQENERLARMAVTYRPNERAKGSSVQAVLEHEEKKCVREQEEVEED